MVAVVVPEVLVDIVVVLGGAAAEHRSTLAMEGLIHVTRLLKRRT